MPLKLPHQLTSYFNNEHIYNRNHKNYFKNKTLAPKLGEAMVTISSRCEQPPQGESTREGGLGGSGGTGGLRQGGGGTVPIRGTLLLTSWHCHHLSLLSCEMELALETRTPPRF